MYKYIDKIWRYIVDIFIDDIVSYHQRDSFQPKDLTEHYCVDFPGISLDRIIVTQNYKSIQSDIEAYKYHSDRSYGTVFVDYIYNILSMEDYNNAAIVTIPMHWTRYAIRGFDHMDYIAKQLSKKIKIPYIKPLSTSFSSRQSKLSRKERFENRKNHFTIKDHKELPLRVFLIDDVISTGATAHECARILKGCGVKEVIGVFLASNAES